MIYGATGKPGAAFPLDRHKILGKVKGQFIIAKGPVAQMDRAFVS